MGLPSRSFHHIVGPQTPMFHSEKFTVDDDPRSVKPMRAMRDQASRPSGAVPVSQAEGAQRGFRQTLQGVARMVELPQFRSSPTDQGAKVNLVSNVQFPKQREFPDCPLRRSDLIVGNTQFIRPVIEVTAPAVGKGVSLHIRSVFLCNFRKSARSRFRCTVASTRLSWSLDNCLLRYFQRLNA